MKDNDVMQMPNRDSGVLWRKDECREDRQVHDVESTSKCIDRRQAGAKITRDLTLATSHQVSQTKGIIVICILSS